MKLLISAALVLVCLSTNVLAKSLARPCSMEFPVGIFMLCLQDDGWEVVSASAPALMAFRKSSAPGSVIEILPGTLPPGMTNRADPVAVANWLAEALHNADRPVAAGNELVLFNREDPPVFKVRNVETPGQTGQLVSPVLRGAKVQIVRTFRKGAALQSIDFQLHAAFIDSINRGDLLPGSF